MLNHRAALCAFVFSLVSSAAIAMPNFGRGCSDCHIGGKPPVDAMSLVNFDGMIDPDESATGATDRGLLKFFEVAPGGSVDLQVMVDFGDLEDYFFAVELKRFEVPGVEGAGELSYTADPDWFFQTGDALPDLDRPYFTNTENMGTPYTGPQLLTFTLQVDAATDPDFYDLEFAMAGQPNFFYTDEHFYVQVVPEPATWCLLVIGFGTCLRRRRQLH